MCVQPTLVPLAKTETVGGEGWPATDLEARGIKSSVLDMTHMVVWLELV